MYIQLEFYMYMCSFYGIDFETECVNLKNEMTL